MYNFKFFKQRRKRGGNEREPSVVASLIPLLALIVMLYMVISIFGSESMDGGNQIALLTSTAVAVAISVGIYGGKWSRIEEAMVENIKISTPAIIILLLIGALSGTWMVSGVVPTMIYYGLQILDPNIFLVSASVICAIVSLITGSSWTTIATIGVALMGVGSAQGFSEGWIAGAIISGAYFGDKLSMLSDTTIMASTTVGVKLFDHIRYMLITTIPAFCIALLIFLVAGFVISSDSAITVGCYSSALKESFHISGWLLIVPLLTGVMIVKRLPAMITLFVSALMASIAMLLTQPQIMAEIAGVPLHELCAVDKFKAVVMSCYGATSITTSSEAVTQLVATRGMEGMLITIWLIICAMCFGGVMMGSGMLQRITTLLSKYARKTNTIVGSTLIGGMLFNLSTADQYISIILTGRLFKGLYEKQGLEPRLLSRSVEDSASVGSVLVPWNSCGMTQAAVLGVSTWSYLPYCFFNLASPIVSFIVATIGYKIVRKKQK
ncbi:MAG: Na+/H+ antiporter NhaC family protein [Rikenellaceae bacterium]